MRAQDQNAHAPNVPRAQAYYALALLMLAAALALADRQIIAILIGPIGTEFHLSDTQLGALMGAAFSVPYVLGVVPIARLSDRGARARIIGACVFFWSMMTALCGAAQNFFHILLARAGVGLGEAGYSAPSQALLSDLFAPPRRALALSVFLTGAPLGMGAGLGLGGWALEYFDWRTAFVIAALPGFALGPLIAFSLPRSAPAQNDAIRFKAAMSAIFAIRSLVPLIAGAALLTLMSTAAAAWTPSFLARVHGFSDGEIGAKLGAALSLGSILGHLAGGALIARLTARRLRAGLTVALGAALVTGPLGALAYNFGREAVFALIGVQFFAGGVASAALSFTMMALAPERARATLAALFLCATTLVGLGMGPLAVGLLSDLLRDGEGRGALRAALTGVMAFGAPASLCLFIAHRRFNGDIERMA